MSLRVAYWTSEFNPEMEAFSGEVAALRRRFPFSVVWGLNRRQWALFSPRRGYCVHPKLHLLFRLVTRLLEPCFHINHVFGSVGDWFYLVEKKRRPTVLTAAAHCTPVEKRLLERVERFVVEYPAGREHLQSLGIDPARIRLIFPPVNLERFVPAPPPDGPFTVVFASSPDQVSLLDARGIPHLLDAAALRPHMHFRLLWRPWGDGATQGNSAAQVRRSIAERGLQNVEVREGYWKDMAQQYNQAHVCAAPFTDVTRSKIVPNSIVEALACGRPALVTDQVGLAEMVREEGAGEISPPTGEALATHLDRLQADWARNSRNARRLAERWFGLEAFLAGYERLYQEVLAN